MSEVSNRRFVHFNGTKDEFIDGGYPDQYQESIVFINGDGNESNNTIYTHGEYYGQGVIVEGDASNSAVLKGEYENVSNRALSQTSMAVGAGTTAGLKGWYYSNIEFGDNPVIKLSESQPIAAFGGLSGGSWSLGTPTSIAVGDKVSIVNNSKYDYCGEVKSISVNKITLKSALPFNKLDIGNGITISNLDDWSIYIPDKPDAGIIDFGGGAFSEGGYNTMATNICAHAEGLDTHAYGQYSHAEGRETKAGYAAHAEGRESFAKGICSHAEGQSTIAGGNKSHAEGTQTETYANNSHAEGYKSIIKDGAGAHIEGYGNVIDFSKSTDVTTTSVTGQSIGAHIEGVSNKGYGIGIHIEGRNNTISDAANCAHIEGENNDGKGRSIHIEGRNNRVNNSYSHAEGFETDAGDYFPDSIRDSYTLNDISENSLGFACHAEGNATVASGNSSHAEGKKTIAYGKASHAEGIKTFAVGVASHCEGHNTVVLTSYSEDQDEITEDVTSTKGYFGHAEGNCTIVVGNSGHAEGSGTRVFGRAAHAEGRHCVAEGNYSHAEGFDTYAGNNEGVLLSTTKNTTVGFFTHAEGHNTLAQGNSSHAEGKQTMALGVASHTSGLGTQATNEAEFACGKYNVSNTGTLFSIGSGTSSKRKNAIEVKNNDVIISAKEINGKQGYIKISDIIDTFKPNIYDESGNILEKKNISVIDDSLECLNETGMLKMEQSYFSDNDTTVLRITKHIISYGDYGDGIEKYDDDEYIYMLPINQKSDSYNITNNILVLEKSNPDDGTQNTETSYYTYTELKYEDCKTIETSNYPYIIDFGALDKKFYKFTVECDPDGNGGIIYPTYVGIAFYCTLNDYNYPTNDFAFYLSAYESISGHPSDEYHDIYNTKIIKRLGCVHGSCISTDEFLTNHEYYIKLYYWSILVCGIDKIDVYLYPYHYEYYDPDDFFSGAHIKVEVGGVEV